MSNNITASFKSGDKEVTCPAINPGGWYGKAWLISVPMGFESNYYIVEGDNPGDAIDEFVDSEEGKIIHIEDQEKSDYGFAVNPGDIIGGVTIEETGWIDLNGDFTNDEKRGQYLQEPGMGGNGGQPYDSEMVNIEGEEGKKCPFKCRYHGEGIPEGGLTPLDYAALMNYEEEIQKYIASLKNVPPGTVEAFAECYEDAKKVGYEAGSTRAHEFYGSQLGGNPFQLIRLIYSLYPGIEDMVGSRGLDATTVEEIKSFIKNAKFLRDPCCHIVWNMEGDLRVPTFTWHNDQGVFNAKAISECPEETRFTFERQLEEETNKYAADAAERAAAIVNGETAP